MTPSPAFIIIIISASPGRTDGEIPDADVVTDDAAADPAAEGEDGEVCEVRTFTFSIFSF